MSVNSKGKIKKRRIVSLIYILIDIAIILLSFICGKVLTFLPFQFEKNFVFLAVNYAVFFILAYRFRLYNFTPATVSVSYLLRVSIVYLITVAVDFIFVFIFPEFAMGRRWLVSYFLFFFLFFMSSRVFNRIYRYVKLLIIEKKSGEYERAIIVGGGSAATLFIRELLSTNKNKFIPVCILDDDKSKHNTDILGVKVAGSISQVEHFAEKYRAKVIIVVIPSAPSTRKKEVYEECVKTGLKVLTVKEMYSLGNNFAPSEIQEVDVKDLLGREQISVNLDEIMSYIENQVVLVTGGSGSIGSELCRQIAGHNPKKLIIFDIYENTTYTLERELKSTFPGIDMVSLIGSVRDVGKLDDIFRRYRPSIVFHAAAHKHVPLMETSPNEAVKNNVLGTYNTVSMADKYGVKRFVLISTDKAVNPTNVMGATKRICEMIVQSFAKHSRTSFVAVRFGNVLGSNGSVIPYFKEQIKLGGPVTVTHKDVTRFFMTIPEAVSLVLQAGAYANGGEIFVLDMGTPVRIVDLAENLIRLSGLVPYEDIDIQFVGLRPGEKLYEERLMDEEGMLKTANELISIGKPIEFDEEKLYKYIEILKKSAYDEVDDIKKLIQEIVPTYKAND